MVLQEVRRGIQDQDGVFIEFITKKGDHLSTRANFPPAAWQDSKFLAIERSFKDKAALPAREFLKQLPAVQPLAGNVIQPYTAPEMQGCFQINPDLFETMPVLDWNQLFHTVEASKGMTPLEEC